MVQESSTARTTLLPFGHGGMDWTRSGGGSLGFGVGAAIGAKIAVGRERPVVLHLGDGALGYSAVGLLDDGALQHRGAHDRLEQRELPDRAAQLGARRCRTAR